jgi:hypothetical protein
MSEQGHSRTLVQFSLRSLFVTATVLSVATALTVPLIRAQSAAFRRVLVCGIVISVGLATAGAIIVCLRRLWLEKRGGELLVDDTRRRTWRDNLPWVIIVAVLATISVSVSVWMFPTLQNVARNVPNWDWVACLAAVAVFAPPLLAFVYTCILLWWRLTPLSPEFRTNGVAIGGLTFLPWNDITVCRWTEAKYAATVLFSCGNRKRIAVVPKRAHESVRALLESKGVKTIDV